ncbi:MAG TPA: DUF4097 family beta strand repeat-containing protein [Vicinamibacterales bacterium]|nr:DUF4097 family beta strand repeat-containing protein [Vicinamibacterales bacterium]
MYLQRARNVVPIAAVALAAWSLAACDIAVQGHGDGGFQFDAGGRAQDEWSRTYHLAAGGQLELINVNGQITAEASDGDTLELRAERTMKASSDEAARDLLSKMEMREEVGDARVRIEVRPPQMRRSGQEVKWTLKIPKGISVDLRTVNGSVKLIGLQGDVRARSTNGGITGDRLLASNIDASVTNGGVEIALAHATASGSIDLESVNGGVSLALPEDSKADVSARCVNGGIRVTDLNLDIIGEQNRRRLEGKLNGGGAHVSLETTNGGVKITRATTS